MAFVVYVCWYMRVCAIDWRMVFLIGFSGLLGLGFWYIFLWVGLILVLFFFLHFHLSWILLQNSFHLLLFVFSDAQLWLLSLKLTARLVVIHTRIELESKSTWLDGLLSITTYLSYFLYLNKWNLYDIHFTNNYS